MEQEVKTRNDVKIIMLKRNITFVKLAGELGIHPNVFYLVLSGKIKSEGATRLLESKLGVPLKDLMTAWHNMDNEEKKAV